MSGLKPICIEHWACPVCDAEFDYQCDCKAHILAEHDAQTKKNIETYLGKYIYCVSRYYDPYILKVERVVGHKLYGSCMFSEWGYIWRDYSIEVLTDRNQITILSREDAEKKARQIASDFLEKKRSDLERDIEKFMRGDSK